MPQDYKEGLIQNNLGEAQTTVDKPPTNVPKKKPEELFEEKKIIPHISGGRKQLERKIEPANVGKEAVVKRGTFQHNFDTGILSGQRASTFHQALIIDIHAEGDDSYPANNVVTQQTRDDTRRIATAGSNYVYVATEKRSGKEAIFEITIYHSEIANYVTLGVVAAQEYTAEIYFVSAVDSHAKAPIGNDETVDETDFVPATDTNKQPLDDQVEISKVEAGDGTRQAARTLITALRIRDGVIIL